MTERTTDQMLDGIFAHARGNRRPSTDPNYPSLTINMSPASEFQAIQNPSGVGGRVSRTPSDAIKSLYQQLVKNEIESRSQAEVALSRLGDTFLASIDTAKGGG